MSSSYLDALRDEIGRLTNLLHGLKDQIDPVNLAINTKGLKNRGAINPGN
ncbi:MAG: hypothetical protein JXA38_06695 [Methanosarcinaceae archaeon]|nr:hypothetical protein [Methanosarcinaceae archaeon]